MGKLRARDKTSALLKTRQQPTVAENPDQKPPIFSFEYLQNGFCILDCTADERSQMLDKLRRLSQLPWSAIRQADRHGLGYEIISRDAMHPEMPACVTDDVKLIAFRAIGRAPMIGFRVGRVFNVLWVDRVFTAYDHS